jgi:hypothetical protein
MYTTPKKDWTVMIYMAGDNDLDDTKDQKSEAIKDLKLIKKIGSTGRVSILAQLDRANEETPRFYLKKGSNLNDDKVDDLGETNTGDPCKMIEFLEWGMREHPARHYLVILWGHGAGALDVDYLTGDDPPQPLLGECYLRRQASRNGNGDVRKLIDSKEMKNLSRGDLFPHHRILYNHLAFAPSQFSLIARDRAKLFGIDLPENGSLDYLDNKELRFIFETIKDRYQRRIDILGMDACLMSMVEIGFQLRGLVDYMVGSQDLVPKEGFPYDRILKRLTDNPGIRPKELSVEIVEHYVESFKAKYTPTLAVCDLTKFDGAIEGSLAGAIDHLAGALLRFIAHKGADTDKARAVRAAILHARGRAQYFDVGDYVDIYHFCDLLEKYWERPDVKKNLINPDGSAMISSKDIRLVKIACRRVKKHFSGPNRFVIASRHKGRPVRNSNGLSIYFPIKGMDPTYRVVDFVEKTVWQNFIDTFVKQIQWLDFLQEFAHNTRAPFRLRIPKPLD